MTQARSPRSAACLAVLVLGVLTSLAGCDKPPGEPKAAPGAATTPAPMPSASAASQ